MPDPIETLSGGSVGFFWPAVPGLPDLDSEAPERGYVRIEDCWANIETLQEDVEWSWVGGGDDEQPAAILAIMPSASAIFLEILGPYPTTHIIGVRASSSRYRARTVVGGLDVTSLRATDPLALRAHFHGISAWPGLTSIHESNTKKADGRLESFSIQLRSSGEQMVRLDRGRRIVISTTWTVGGPVDHRTIAAPVTIGCEAPRACQPGLAPPCSGGFKGSPQQLGASTRLVDSIEEVAGAQAGEPRA